MNDRLLTPLELSILKGNEFFNGRWYYDPYEIIGKQDAKTASIKNKEWCDALLQLIAWVNRHRFIDEQTLIEAIAIGAQDEEWWENLTTKVEQIVGGDIIHLIKVKDAEIKRLKEDHEITLHMLSEDFRDKCQQRIESLLKEIEGFFFKVHPEKYKKLKPPFGIEYEEWQRLKKKAMRN